MPLGDTVCPASVSSVGLAETKVCVPKEKTVQEFYTFACAEVRVIYLS